MSSATMTIDDRVAEFAAAVGEHFADLPEAERDELLADLEQHLKELAADAPDAFEAEMGDPAAYAAELRAGAGLDQHVDQPGRIGRWGIAARDRVRSVLDHPRMEPVHEFVPMLRPAWWIVRAWAPLVVLGMLTEGAWNWSRHLIIPGRHLLGLLALAVAIGLSARAGLRGEDEGRIWRAVAVIGGIAAVIVLWSALFVSPRETVFVETFMADPFGEQPGLLTHPDGEGITNLYVYDANGELLRDVFVYDGAGRAVEVGAYADEWYGIESDVRIDADGRVVGNLYPLTQYVRDGEGALVLRDVPEVSIPRLSGTEQPAPPPDIAEEPATTTSVVEERVEEPSPPSSVAVEVPQPTRPPGQVIPD